MSQLPDDEGRNPYLRANSLEELLSWSDLDFVRCAYVTLLGRPPDLAGQAHYVEQIRAGNSKLDILGQLRRSPEAKQHDPGIAGLDRALKRAAWQRRPLLGAISRFFRSNADGQSRNDRALRALINATSLNQHYLHAISERLTAIAASSGLKLSPLAEHANLSAHTDQVLKSYSTQQGHVFSPEQTPELDHLRTNCMASRYIEDVAP